MKKNIQSQFKSVLLASLCFSVIHIINLLNEKISVESCVNQMIFAFYVGILLQSLYLKFGSIILVSFLHSFINFFSGYKLKFQSVVAEIYIQKNDLLPISDWFVSVFVGIIIVFPIAYLIILSEKDFSIR